MTLQTQYGGADTHTKHAAALGDSAQDVIFPDQFESVFGFHGNDARDADELRRSRQFDVEPSTVKISLQASQSDRSEKQARHRTLRARASTSSWLREPSMTPAVKYCSHMSCSGRMASYVSLACVRS